MTVIDSDLTVRACSEADDGAILELLRTALGPGPTGEKTQEFFAWKHRRNPFGSSPGLVAVHQDKVVAVRLFLRWRLRARGQTVPAVRAVDTATSPDYRGRGLFRNLTLELLSQLDRAGEVALVFNTPNRQSRPGYLSMGWREVGTLPVRVAPVRPLRFLGGALAASRTVATSRHAGPTTAVPVPTGTPPFVAARTFLESRGPELEALLQGREEASGLHTESSLAYWRWRYGDPPGLDYRCIPIEGTDGLRAVAFGRMRSRGALKEFTLSELTVRAGDRRAARSVLATARRSGADHVTVLTAPGTAVDHAARRIGFLRVPGQGLGLVVNQRRPMPVEPHAMSSWHVCLGDLEVF